MSRRILPILFNTEMVRAILDGRKTVTRRLPSKKVEDKWFNYKALMMSAAVPEIIPRTEREFYEQYPPYHPGDILYVRENDRARWWQYVTTGKVPAWLYFVKFEGMTKDEAVAMVKEAQPDEPKLFGDE